MTTIRQFLGKKVFENKILRIDRWIYLHIALFFFIGVFYPNRLMLVIIAMVVFEIIEATLSKRQPFFKESIKDTISDLGFNLLGYFAGQYYIGII